MLTIRDDDRKFPMVEIPYLDMTLDDLFEQWLAIKRANCPNWTDESPSDFGVLLGWMHCVLMRWLADQLELAKDDTYIGTARTRQSMKRLCDLIGYTMSEATAAVVSVRFSLAVGHPAFTISKGTQVSTAGSESESPIVFETVADMAIGSGPATIDIECTQGETVSQEIVGSSDGSTNQRFNLKLTPVVWCSEIVETFDGYVWTTWARVDTFANSTGADNHYRIALDDNDQYQIRFGDGQFGKVPPRGQQNIRVTYRKGGGVIGNVGVASITKLVNPVTYVTAVNNALAATGGQERESIEVARILAPAAVRALDRCVTVTDIETMAKIYVSPVYGRVAAARVISVAGLSFSVMIVPRSGGLPTAAHRAELQSYLSERKLIATSIEVAEPVYRTVDITATITPMPNYSPSDIAARVREALVSYLSPAYQDPSTGLYPNGFGRNVYLSDIYRVIDGVTGVDHTELAAPTANVIIDQFQIADIGALSLTIVGSDGRASYYSNREDIDRDFRDKVLAPKGKGSRSV